MIAKMLTSDVLYKIAKSPSVLEFVTKLTPEELDSFRSFLTWPPALLVRFRNDPSHLNVLHKVWDVFSDMPSFSKSYLAMVDHPSADGVNIQDAFSQGQLKSKSWLVDEVSKLDMDLGKVWILCGWIGTLGYIMLSKRDFLRFESIKSFDIDPRCAPLADTLNRPNVIDGWKFKATTMDVNDLRYDGFKFTTIKYDGTAQEMLESADTIINTSCDHMDSQRWFNNIPSGKLVILQNNNFSDHHDHVNTVASIDQFKSRYPMKEYLYEGEIDCTVYRRYMLIGRT